MSYSIGEQMRRLRKQNQMTQGDLAKAAGVSQQTISNIESGRMVSDKRLFETLGKILGGSLVFEDVPPPAADFVRIRRFDESGDVVLPANFWQSLRSAITDPAAVTTWQQLGGSMLPTLHHGDDVLVDCSSREIVNGGLYLIAFPAMPELVQLKRLFWLPDGRLQLHDDGDKEIFPPMMASADDVEILGKAVGVVSFRVL